MSSAINVTLSEFQSLLSRLSLPLETRLTVTFEDERSELEVLRRKKALDALQKLKGSGSGTLNKVLLQEREEDQSK